MRRRGCVRCDGRGSRDLLGDVRGEMAVGVLASAVVRMSVCAAKGRGVREEQNRMRGLWRYCTA